MFHPKHFTLTRFYYATVGSKTVREGGGLVPENKVGQNIGILALRNSFQLFRETLEYIKYHPLRFLHHRHGFLDSCLIQRIKSGQKNIQ
jgi:hypothetical protein